MDMQSLAVFFMVAVAFGGVAWVFIYPLLSGERHAERRKETVARTGAVAQARSARNAQKTRREQVEGSLKDLEARQAKQKSVPLHLKIAQAGLNWSKRQFILVSAVMGLGAFLLFLLIEAGLWAALAIGFAAGFGMPLWLLKYLKKRREAKFLNGFPDAVDTIVRGIKAGLPLLDSMRIISADAQEPIRSEFRAIMETQAIGMPVGEACAKLYERIPIAEANFFAIVITIQTKVRRQSVGSAWQPHARAARPQEDESQDPGHVDGGQGLGIDHRLPAVGGDAHRLPHQPALYRAAVDPSDRTHDACRMRGVDAYGRHGDAQDDQLRFLIPVWRFRSPQHCCRESECGLLNLGHTGINRLLVSFDSEVRIGGRRKIVRTSELRH